MITTRKIDFFGGVHGNYLELVVNYSIDQNPYDITKQQFTTDGACHNKNQDSTYVPITKANHWSYYGHKFNHDDLVIRIVIESNDLLIATTNSFLRAGDQLLDLNNLEQDTFKKMESLPKMKLFLDTLIQDHGIQDSYPKKILRNYFYSMFDDSQCGLNMFNTWLPVDNYHNFQFSNFFNFVDFFEALQKIAKFVNIEFQPSLELIKLHTEFLSKNQGWQSHIKCSKIAEAIVKQENTELDLNVIEEAWISWKIAQAFNLYDLKCLQEDCFPKETAIIIDSISRYYKKGNLC
jgi:hypothetical protein